MPHETVPADIAAAIDAFDKAAQAWGWEADMGTGGSDTAEAMNCHETARAALNAAILKYLRNADAMKAALERIEQGV